MTYCGTSGRVIFSNIVQKLFIVNYRFKFCHCYEQVLWSFIENVKDLEFHNFHIANCCQLEEVTVVAILQIHMCNFKNLNIPIDIHLTIHLHKVTYVFAGSGAKMGKKTVKVKKSWVLRLKSHQSEAKEKIIPGTIVLNISYRSRLLCKYKLEVSGLLSLVKKYIQYISPYINC